MKLALAYVCIFRYHKSGLRSCMDKQRQEKKEGENGERALPSLSLSIIAINLHYFSSAHALAPAERGCALEVMACTGRRALIRVIRVGLLEQGQFRVKPELT